MLSITRHPAWSNDSLISVLGGPSSTFYLINAETSIALAAFASPPTGNGFVHFRDYCVLPEEWQKEQRPLTADVIADKRINKQDLAAFCEQWLTPCH